jgi:hypothetical protein
MPYEVTAEMIAEGHSMSPWAATIDRFCAQWLEENCEAEDLETMKRLRPFYWGTGTAYSETELLAERLGRPPSRAEVEREIARAGRIMDRCFKAMTETRKYLEAQSAHEAALAADDGPGESA